MFVERTGPDSRPAVTVGEQSLQRAELFGAAAAVAARIGGSGSVAVDATATLHTVVAVLGCLLAGVPAVPIPPDSGPRELAHVLGDCGATVWLTAPGRPAPASPAGQPERVVVDLTARAAPPPSDDVDAGAPALIMYTSGTTGAPKGVVLSRRAVAAGIDAVADAWAWTPDDVLAHGLPMFHVHGLVLGVLGALRIGSPLVHTLRPTPAGYAGAVETYGASVVFGVPTVWTRVAADPGSARAMAGARLLVSGSAPLPVSVARAVGALTGQVPVERYGMTETLITLATRAEADRTAGWVGTPVAGVQVRVRDEDGAPVAADGDTPGDLEVRGATLFEGYLNRPDATAASWTLDGWFRTGDVAAVDNDGRHRIVGRWSTDLIKSGGYRIGAGEVEAALLDHPGVREAAVIGAPDADLGQRIVAYVVGYESGHVAGRATGQDAGPSATARELIDHVAQTLSVHKRPREIRFVDSLPRNAMGKIQKNVLLDEQ